MSNFYPVIAIITADGIEYDMSGFPLRMVDGLPNNLGLNDVDFHSYRPYDADYEVHLNYQLKPRNFSIGYHVRTGGNMDIYWQARRDLLNAIRPNRLLDKTLDPSFTFVLGLHNGETYYIKALIESAPLDQPSDIDIGGFFTQLTMKALNPLFFGDTIQLEVDQDSEGELQIPHDMPHELGDENVFGTGAINYLGTWRSAPKMIVTGPFDMLEFRHVETGRAVQVLKSAIVGETITVDMVSRSIYDADGVILTQYMGLVDDLTDFYLYPDPQIAGGVNNIQAIVPGFTLPDTTVIIEYANHFESL